MVISRSMSATATARHESHPLAPAATASATAASTTSNTTSWWPALSRLRAMGAPMLPSPMNPILIRSSCVVYGRAKRRLSAGRASAGELAGDQHPLHFACALVDLGD